MSGSRERLAPVVTVWLVCQLVVLASAPFAPCCWPQVSPNAAQAHGEHCQHAAERAETCPMHPPSARTTHDGRSDSAARCILSGAYAHAPTVLLSMATGLGVPVNLLSLRAGSIVMAVATADAVLPSRVRPPDSPPPRISV